MRKITWGIVLSVSAAMIGCAGGSNSNIGSNSNQNRPAVNATPTVVTGTPAPADVASTASAGSLATPSDAYRTAHALREKKDLAGLKSILAKDVIEFLSMIAEGENRTLDDEVAKMFEKPQAKSAEIRNEKIKGDRATLEYLDEKGQWKTMDFTKEGTEWKLSLPAKDDVEIETGPSKRPN